MAPRPHPIDPAVFYDLVKIRKAVDEATNIAVRAASGVTSASLNASLSANNGMLNGAGAAALGLGFGGTGGGAKLSRERKHRMRELATQKLSLAYHLDEIAASVATMQSASTLEDLASHVLQRNPLDYDARYVHFFHEKIPSRMMAEYTPLDPLNRLLDENRSDGPAFRTRALTRIFKEDYAEAARDLSEGLVMAKIERGKHKAGRDQLVLASEAAKQRATNGTTGKGDWRNEVQIAEEDQPSSLEAQLLFHRGNVHLALACQHVHDALDAYWDEQEAKELREREHNPPATNANGEAGDAGEIPKSAAERTAHKRHLDYRKMVKSNAKKALRDYLDFLKHFDYTPGIPPAVAEEFMRRINAAAAAKKANGNVTAKTQAAEQPLDAESGALIPAARRTAAAAAMGLSEDMFPPPPEIYPSSHLFQEKIPASIPPYPSPTARGGGGETHESITYHPLLTDALHSLLLCHSLLQTSPTELKRHACNAARLARICDGYPIFLAARSPARADWVEVLRRSANWIGLTRTWEDLCRPAPLPSSGNLEGSRGWTNGGGQEVTVKKREGERRKHEAILEALADDRVVDEESFQRAVRARERRAVEDEKMAERARTLELENGEERKLIEDVATPPPESESTKSSTPKKPNPSANGTSHANGAGTGTQSKRWAQDEGKDYPISTERAEAISRWVREAPLTVEGAGKGKKKKSGASSRKKAATSTPDTRLEVGMEGMRVQEEVE